MVPNWDIGMGPKPGPWGTDAEEVPTVERESFSRDWRSTERKLQMGHRQRDSREPTNMC